MIRQEARIDKALAALRQQVAADFDQFWQTIRASLLAGPVPFATLEAQVQAGLQPIGRRIVETTATLDGAGLPAPACATCGRRLRRVEAARPRELLGWFGSYTLARPYFVCPAGHRAAVPADEAWGLGPSHLSPSLAALVSRLTIEMPFDQVPEVVAAALHIAIDGDTVRRVVEGLGQVAEAAEQAAATAATGPADGPRAPITEMPAPAPTQPAPDGLVIAVDGAMVHTEGAWHEAKVGVCQPLRRTAEGPVVPHGEPDYCVGFESRAEFWRRLDAHAVATGVTSPRCRLVALIGDGAHWIWDDGAAYFGEAGRQLVDILDFYHAAEHVGTVAHAVWGEGTPAARDWAQGQLTTLQAQGPDALLDALAALDPETAPARTVVTRERGYFQYHRDRMHYPRYRALGLPIGSGRVEGACKTVLKQRLSQAGMRWRVRGAQAVATLRALHRSGRWAAFWATQPQRVRVLNLPRCAA